MHFLPSTPNPAKDTACRFHGGRVIPKCWIFMCPITFLIGMASYTFCHYSASKCWVHRRCSGHLLITYWFCTPVLSSIGNAVRYFGPPRKTSTSVFSPPFHFLTAESQLYPHNWNYLFGHWQTLSFCQKKCVCVWRGGSWISLKGIWCFQASISWILLLDDTFLILLSSIHIFFSCWAPSLALDFFLNLLFSMFSLVHSFSQLHLLLCCRWLPQT